MTTFSTGNKNTESMELFIFFSTCSNTVCGEIKEDYIISLHFNSLPLIKLTKTQSKPSAYVFLLSDQFSQMYKT